MCSSKSARLCFLASLAIVVSFVCLVDGQCPWPDEIKDLHSDCTCDYNNVRQLSIQCSPVNFTRLVSTLHDSVKNIPIDVLYINNGSELAFLNDSVFNGLAINNLHISKSGLKVIHERAFVGLNSTLQRLSLPENQLDHLPMESLSGLTTLQNLDLSANQIQILPDHGLKTLRLSTLKLADNPLTNISRHAFYGLEPYLKNLNLKGTSLTVVPDAIENLNTLAFLDLAQNKIQRILSGQFKNLHSLAALSLERNKIAQVDGDVFSGVNDTLSSLSLLNNLLTEFPLEAIGSLTELRVLDLGFNAIQHLPEEAFHKNSLLTLLALDGNPIPTLPLEGFKHLRSTLRGISIGGKDLLCDCKLSWILQWIKDFNLQVTSRERNPQFCGRPERLRRRTFMQITREDLACPDEATSTSAPIALAATTVASTVATTRPPIVLTGTSNLAKSSRRLPNDWNGEMSRRRPESNNDLKSNEFLTEGVVTMPIDEADQLLSAPSATASNVSSQQITSDSLSIKPNFAKSEQPANQSNEGIKIMNAYRRESSVIVEWDGNLVARDLQIVYRLFGRKEFKKGPKLSRSSRRYVLPHLPSNECIIICAVSTSSDLKTLSSDDVPSSSCREVRRERGRIADLDKVVIGATAALCAFVVMAIIMLSCCYRKDSRKKSLPSLPPPPAAMVAVGGCPMKPDNEWETVSMYSTRSIPRARMYHLDDPTAGNVNGGPHMPGSMMNGSIHTLAMDDARSHVSNYSHLPNGGYGKRNMPPTGPVVDGQSHRSYSQLSNRFNGTCTLPHTDLSKVSSASHHQLHHINHHPTSGHHHMNGGPGGGSFLTNLTGYQVNKKRSKSCNRLNSSSSLHSLTEYDSDTWHHNGHHKMSTGWKDNGVDVYVDKNQLLPNPMSSKFMASR